MAQEQVNGIIQALIAGQQLRLKKQEQIQSASRNAQVAKDEDERRKLEQGKLDELVRQHDQENTRADATHAAEMAINKLSQIQTQQKIGADLAAGQSFPGDKVTQTSAPDSEGDIFETHNIPGVGEIRIPSRETMLKHATAARKAELAPQLENDLTKIKAQGDISSSISAAGDVAAMERTNVQQTGENSREKIRQDAENSRAKLQRQTQVEIANIKTNPDTSDFDPTPYIKGTIEGRVSDTDLAKLPKSQKAVVTNILSKGGVVPVSDKQKQFVAGLGGAVEAIGQMDEYIQHLNDTGLMASIGIGSDASNKESAIKKQINEKLVQATNAMMTGSSRLSKERIEAMQSAYGMTSNPLKGNTNQLNRDGLVDNLESIIDTEIPDKTMAQHIKESIGLDKYITKEPKKANTPKVIRYDASGNRIPEKP